MSFEHRAIELVGHERRLEKPHAGCVARRVGERSGDLNPI
jgi:hypothetical protein